MLRSKAQIRSKRTLVLPANSRARNKTPVIISQSAEAVPVILSGASPRVKLSRLARRFTSCERFWPQPAQFLQFADGLVLGGCRRRHAVHFVTGIGRVPKCAGPD